MNQNLLLILIAALVLAALLWAWTRRRAAERASREARSRPRVSDNPLPAATWAPPRYDVAQAAITGPSLRVGISIIQLRDAGLLVSWNATNNGSVPAAVQWGAPEVRVEHDGLQLCYTQEATPSFVPPATRTYQPSEIVSRSATVTRDAIGRELAGMRVTVAVGYGSAAEHEAACADQGAYLDWQRVAISPPRIVPRG